MVLDYAPAPDPDVDAYERSDAVEALFDGAVDLHVHPGPSPLPRRVGIDDVARDAFAVGFRAIVVKSHHASMQTDVLALRAAGALPDGLDVFSGVALNRTVGGVNPYAVELFLKLGARVVWLPTIASSAHYRHEHDQSRTKFPGSSIDLREHEPVPVVDEARNVRAEVCEVMEIVKSEGAILNMGHLGAEDIDVLIPKAREIGVDRMVVSHPSFIIGGTPDRAREWARQGALIEQCLSLLTSRRVRRLDLDGLVSYIRAVGAGSTVMSSDLGQRGNPLPLTAYRVIIPKLLAAGFTAEDLRTMMRDNPAGLLYPAEGGTDGQDV